MHGEGGPQERINAEVLERSSLPYVFPLAKNLVKNRCETTNTSEGGSPKPSLTSIQIGGTAGVILSSSLNLGNNTSGTRYSRRLVSATTKLPSTVAFLPIRTSHLSRSSQLLEGCGSGAYTQRLRVMEVKAGTEEMEDRMSMR